MKYAVEYDVHTEDNLKSFEPVVFLSEEAVDNEEFNMIVKGKKDVIVEDFTTYGLTGTNPDAAASIRVIDNGSHGGHFTFRAKGSGMGASQSEIVRFEQGGNVGISNSSPSSKIHIGSNSTSGVVDIGLQNSSRHYTIKSDSGDFKIRDEIAIKYEITIDSTNLKSFHMIEPV